MSDTNRAVAAPAVGRLTGKPLKQCSTLEEAFGTRELMERIEACVPKHVTPNRMLRTFVSAVQKAPLLAQADIRTYIGACLTLAQLGLEPATPLNMAHLIPFKSGGFNGKPEIVTVNVVLGYQGLLDLAYRSPLVKSIHANIVMPGDDFDYSFGSNAHLEHRPRGRHKDSDEPDAAYMFASLAEGGFAMEVMPWSNVLRIRNQSQAYRQAFAAKERAAEKGWNVPSAWTEAPWVKHIIAMGRKTPIRSGVKYMPRQTEMLSAAVAIDEASERRGAIDFSGVLDQNTIDGTVDYVGAAADVADRWDDPDETQRRDEEAADRARQSARTQVQVNRTPDQQRQDTRQPDHQQNARQDTRQEPPRDQRQQPPQQQTQQPQHRQAEPTQRRDEPQQQQRQAPQQQPVQHQQVQRDAPRDTQQQDSGSRWNPNSGFDAFLLDPYGEPVTIDGADMFGSPETWAATFRQIWEDSFPADREPMIELNQVTIDMVRSVPEAWAKIRDIVEPPQQSDAPAEQQAGQQAGPQDDGQTDGGEDDRGSFSAIPVPQDRGKPNWTSYVKQFGDAAAALAAEDLSDWLEAQRVVAVTAPKAQLLLIVRAVVQSCAAADLTPPEWATRIMPAKKDAAPAAQQQTAEPAQQTTQQQDDLIGDTGTAAQGEPAQRDHDLAFANDFVKQVQAAKSNDDVIVLSRNELIRKRMSLWKTERPDLYAMVDKAFTARHA